jgi:hypothetical protein
MVHYRWIKGVVVFEITVDPSLFCAVFAAERKLLLASSQYTTSFGRYFVLKDDRSFLVAPPPALSFSSLVLINAGFS